MFVTTTPGKELAPQRAKIQVPENPPGSLPSGGGGSNQNWGAPEQVSHRVPQTQRHLEALRGHQAAPRLCSPPCPGAPQLPSPPAMGLPAWRRVGVGAAAQSSGIAGSQGRPLSTEPCTRGTAQHRPCITGVHKRTRQGKQTQAAPSPSAGRGAEPADPREYSQAAGLLPSAHPSSQHKLPVRTAREGRSVPGLW